ncbi:MAG: hypothetical protein Q4B68_05985 [Bacteroidales bacterium]|nr:hypothetical protein [Bacteroidales bacterium]
MSSFGKNKAEKDCKWHPIYRSDNDNGVGPSEPMSENFRQTPYASLVREAIQNSLDVTKKCTTEPMEISFSIGTIDTQNFPNFFAIRKHIQGCIDNFPNNEKAKKTYLTMLSYMDKVNRPGRRLPFIRISDRNTQGMPYDNLSSNDSPFYAFVRSAGVSSKADESAGGSFGFGKAAYFYLSPMRTILVSTKTQDGRYFFEGVASLCSHKIDGRTVSNLVYYDNNEGNPTTKYEEIPARFQRKDDKGNEIGSGTDIFIMGVDFENYGSEEDIYNEMFCAVLENFWYAVLDGKLVVKIGKNDNERIINSSNIAELISTTYEEHDIIKRGSKYNPRPYFDSVYRANSSEKYVHRDVNLSKNERLRKIATLPLWGTAKYYFYKNKQASNRILYMRGLRMKVSITPARNGEGYYGVIICPDGQCNTWLRKTENPAHDAWEPKRLESKADRKIARELLSVIEEEKDKIIREIFNLDAIETVKIKGLEQYLYISSESDDDDENEGESSTEGAPTGVFVDNGFSPTTDSENIRDNPVSENESLLGAVLKQRPGATTPDENGNLLTGRGYRKIKKPHTSKHVSTAKPRQRNTQKNGDPNSHSLEPVFVKYRTFAQNVNSTVVHKLIINSDKEIENGRIDLLIGGESSDSKISIVSSSEGEVQQNSITNLRIPIGKYTIEIKFADNLKHSIKLSAYEVK